ncbi:MAG: 2-amino-4-hydroxy-6-hydroxymethyldihydropteridine diphosphokinase [Xanthomonadales bacterium]|nr:2-amino-4-hydroxy-6-hydroxymethyldihydropteridine diphosphokinase [Xanthomonadales bacterium]
MSDERVFIGLGGNVGEPLRQIGLGLAALDDDPGVSVVRVSRMYESPPWGITDQPSFINAVAELRSSLSPSALLRCMRGIEESQGRQRELKWGPRTLDLDLLAFGGRISDEVGLTIPHPRIAERAFVLVPWAEIAPEFQVPGLASVAELLKDCADAAGVEPLSQDEACTEKTAANR